jgi:hypothetical protein
MQENKKLTNYKLSYYQISKYNIYLFYLFFRFLAEKQLIKNTEKLFQQNILWII